MFTSPRSCAYCTNVSSDTFRLALARRPRPSSNGSQRNLRAASSRHHLRYPWRLSSTPDRFDSPTLANRREQMFPTLTPAEIEAARRFAAPRTYRDGERIFETGKPASGLHVIVSGRMRITGRDGRGHDLRITEHGAGQFAGELSQLTGARAWVDGTAVGDVEALVLDAERLRKLVIAEALLGEKLMRALILRRMAILESGTGGAGPRRQHALGGGARSAQLPAP